MWCAPCAAVVASFVLDGGRASSWRLEEQGSDDDGWSGRRVVGLVLGGLSRSKYRSYLR